MSEDRLRDRVAVLERRLSVTEEPKRPAEKSASKGILAEIDDLERRLNAMNYMEDDDDAMFMEDEGPELGIDELDADDELGMGDELAVEVDPFGEVDELDVLGELGMDDDGDLGDLDDLDGEIGCGGAEMLASEVDPNGVEEQITQDYLSEVEDEVHGEELTTGKSMLDIAPTTRKASKEYTARLVKASARLDRVASYLEKGGRTKLALRVDTMADAIDARIKEVSRRA